MDKLQVKRGKSFGKEKLVKDRAKGWEDVNGEGKKKKKAANGFDALEEDAKKEDREWVSDEDMDGNDLSAPVAEVNGESKEAGLVAPASIPLPVVEDELL